jgi:hypothetical protein
MAEAAVSDDDLRVDDSGVPIKPDAPSSSIDIDSLVRQSLPPSVDAKGITKKAGEVTREKIAEEGAVGERTARQMRSDEARVHAGYEGIEPLDVKPWNADQERQKRTTSPIDAFGSFGSAFAMIASAFTHQPLINGLNGAAAAMNAIHARDDKAYDSAFDAWKENTKLAIKRHEMERESFQDAIKLMDTDQAAGTVELQNVARKYGDKMALAMIDGGYIKELVDLQNSRAGAARGLISVLPQLESMDRDKRILSLDPDWNSNDPARMNLAIQRLKSGKLSPEQDAYDAFVRENPNAKAEDRSKFIQTLKQYGMRSPQSLALHQFIDEFTDREGRPPNADEIAGFMAKISRTGAGAGTMAGAERMAVDKELDQIRKKTGREPNAAETEEAIKKVKQSATALTGNKQDEIRTRIDMFDNSNTAIDRSLDVLNRYVGAAGIAGRATRIVERVSDILGSNKTDREQFMRDIQYLKLNAPRLLTSSTGRPLSSEAGRIDDIIGGLSLGDTTANTIRSLEEIQRLYKKMQQDAKARLEGTWVPPDERDPNAPPAAQPGGAGQPRWMSAPKVQ